jgi:hypothetical protein
MTPNLRFSERINTDSVAMALLSGLVLIEGLVSYNVWHVLRPVGILHAVMAAAFFVLTILLRRFHIRVTASELTFGFGPFRKTVKLSDIRRTGIGECSLATTGIGIHFVRGYWAWVAKAGTAVQITLAPGRTVGYIISTTRPRDLVAALTGTGTNTEPQAS